MTEFQRITEHNLATSPFLDLPGEVRNRIYEFTLGGNIWNIDAKGRAINLTPKANPERPPGFAPRLSSNIQ
ncbi:unnamed protein product [Alternaria alternata]